LIEDHRYLLDMDKTQLSDDAFLERVSSALNSVAPLK